MKTVIHKNQWYWGNTLTIITKDGKASVELQFDNKYPTIAFIKGLIVHSTCRKQGIGNTLLDICFREAENNGKKFLQLNVLKDSWLVKWYERKGFTIIYDDDDEFTMWKELETLRPQKQNPWTEQDQKKVERLTTILYDLEMESNRMGKYAKFTVWLNSLCGKYGFVPQKHWKPSEKQMEALLSEVTGWTKGCPKQKILETLYNDLKKLKEE